MKLSDALALIGIIVALATFAATFLLARRVTGQPDFHVTRVEGVDAWTVAAHNVGAAPAVLAWFDVVDDPGGRIVTAAGEGPRNVAVTGRLTISVRAGCHATGRGLELVWLDAHHAEHRRQVGLPACAQLATHMHDAAPESAERSSRARWPSVSWPSASRLRWGPLR